MRENAITWTNTKHETERYEILNCLNKIHTTVPLEGSEENRMLQTNLWIKT